MIQINDRVRFSANFLKFTGQHTGPDAPTNHGPWARGKVTAVREDIGKGVCTVQWDNGVESKVMRFNLEKVDEIGM